jgi:hypothetical protein
MPKKINNTNYLKKDSYKKKSKINSLRSLQEYKCKDRNEESISRSLCLSCNIEEGYYPIYYGYNYDNSKENIKTYLDQYIDCYNQESIPSNYYLNSKLQAYEKCYESCKTCKEYGDQNNNNCDSCNDNYIFKPDVDSSKNCVLKCQFYYYYNSVGEYTCTEYDLCPPQLNLAIENKKKCVSNCNNDDNFKYQYNGECLNKCPENTELISEDGNICESTLDYCYIDSDFKTYCYNESSVSFPYKYKNTKIYLTNCANSQTLFDVKTYRYQKTCYDVCPIQTSPNEENLYCSCLYFIFYTSSERTEY